MRYLTVAYDPDCGLCTRIGTWIAEQPKWIPLRIVPVSSLVRLYPMFEIVGRTPGSARVPLDPRSIQSGPAGEGVGCGPGVRPTKALTYDQELTVVSDEGGVYFGDHAWLMCLYALKRYRLLARRLSRPALLPFARQAFKIVSANRHRISTWLGTLTDSELEAQLRQIHAPRCHGTNS
jgi:predicted DCC family thiol-disulfide oxidoreductase YuxK